MSLASRAQSPSGFRMMLRPDLSITRSEEGEEVIYLLRDPQTGEVFEFGELEYVILDLLDGRRDAAAVRRGLRDRTGADLSDQELAAFLSLVGSWGLLVRKTPPEEESVGRRDFRPSRVTQGAGRKANRERRAGERDSPPPRHVDPIAAESRTGAPAPGQEVYRVGTRGWSASANAGALFRLLHILFSPLRVLVYLIPLLLIIAAATIFQNMHLLKVDLPRLWSSWNIIQHLLFSMVTVNLLSQLSMGVVAKDYRVPDLKFGIRLVFGILPRFNLRIDDLSMLARRELLWVHATPMLLRLTTLSIGVIGWLMMRASGTLLPTFMLVLAIVSLISFLLTANPLAAGNGYAFLATLLNMPDLRQKAYRALLGRLFVSRRTRGVQDEEHRFALRAYAVASTLFLVAFVGIVLILTARWLELNYQGTGVAIFVALVVILGWNFRRQIVQRRQSRLASQAGVSTGRSLTPATGVVPIHSGSPFPVVDIPAPPRRRRIRWVRALVLGILVACLFVPYPYETGGVATILSVQQRDIHTETMGVLEEVFFAGGEWVSKGALIGRLSTYEQRKNIALTRAEIAEQEAKLEKLLTTPRKEEVDVAMKQLDSARVRAKFSTANAKRYEELYKSKSVSLDDLEDALKRAEVDRTEVIEKEAELELIKSGVHPKEIEAARSQLDALKEELSYHLDQLERTNLVAPFSGQIVTTDLAELVGKYFDRGDLFVITQDSRSLRVEILVPESDIGDVSEGALTRLKIWTYPDQIFEGRVAEIGPVANPSDYGKVVRVVSEIPNTEKLLKAGMTGFGKIDGGTKPVYEAFTRMLVRFVLIEAWSWLP